MGLLCCYITFANSKLLTSLCFDAEIHAHLKELPRLDVTRIVHIGKSCRTEGWQWHPQKQLKSFYCAEKQLRGTFSQFSTAVKNNLVRA